jgi:late competence protein required for DNA uptake (superfamily II DNA/RNA helicase)
LTFSKLGTDSDTGQIVELSQASRRQGLYIIGANGTGKTGLIEHLILQDIDQGLGVGLLDPHGDLVNAILAKMTKRLDDVILLDIAEYN